MQINKNQLLISDIHRLKGRVRQLNQVHPHIIVLAVVWEAWSTMGTPKLRKLAKPRQASAFPTGIEKPSLAGG